MPSNRCVPQRNATQTLSLFFCATISQNSHPSRFFLHSIQRTLSMKKSGLLAASVAAASATAASLSSSSHQDGMAEKRGRDNSSSPSSSSSEKFAPRFDGLRFIETLVTAHR